MSCKFMGRKLKYHTKEEKVIAQRRWSLNYYNKNKEKVDKDAK